MKRSKDTDLIFSRQDVDRLIAGLEEQIAKRDAYIATLEARIVELEKALKVPTKTSKNSSSRPSSDYKSNKLDGHDSQKKKRRNGHGKGGRGLHDTPNQVFEMTLTTCPDCGESLEEDAQTLHTTYDKVELPEVQPVVTRVHLYKCRCVKCGFVGICPAPVGYEPGSPFTLSVAQELIDLKYNHFMSYKRLSSYMLDRFQISVSQGAIASIFKRHKDCFDARVTEILERIRRSRLICSDETSARVNGNNEWEWVFQNEDVALHVIRASRGAAVVEETMGGHRPQFWVSDLYSAQQGHGEQWQICLAHQLRDCEYSIQEGDVYFSWRLKKLILKAIALHKRRHRPFVLNNLEKWLCRLEDELKGILEFEPETPSGKRLKKRYLKNGSSLFTFLQDPQAVPATNNGSERAIRLSTIYRRVTGGFRSDWGKHFFASVRSVVNTGQKHKLTPRQSIQRTLGRQSTFFLT
jgi:transposase